MLKHNKETLNQIELYIQNNQNCCVVNPCGSGKTSIIASIIKNHIDSKFIIITKQRNAAKYFKEYDSVFTRKNVSIITYRKTALDYKNDKTNEYACDFLIIDEAHYIGAPTHKKSILTIKNRFAPIMIGLTATPQRYEQQKTGTNIVSEFFDNNWAGNYTIKELEKNKILVQPDYVLSLYNLDSIIDKISDQMNKSGISETHKKSITTQLNAIQDDWNRNDNPEKVISEILPKYLYKPKCNRIIIYTKNLKDLEIKKEYMDNLFNAIFPKKQIKSYVYTYKTPESVLSDFLTEDNTDIKLLYSIDKIMETIHIKDLRIIIMLRPAVSNRIITQQAGRLNNIGNKQRPLIIDMVANINNFTFEIEELNSANRQKTGNGINAISLSRYTKYVSLFANIDRIINQRKVYTYNGITGTIAQLCYIFDADKKIVLDNINDGIEIAIQKARKQQLPERSNAYTINAITSLCSDEKIINKYIHIYENFIKHHNINDNEDLSQELYIAFLDYLKRLNTLSHNFYANIVQFLTRYYCNYMRNEQRKENIFAESSNKITEFNFFETQILNKITIEQLFRIAKNVTKKERTCIELHILHNLPYDAIGEIYCLTKERIRQIICKGLRKLNWYMLHKLHYKSLDL